MANKNIKAKAKQVMDIPGTKLIRKEMDKGWHVLAFSEDSLRKGMTTKDPTKDVSHLASIVYPLLVKNLLKITIPMTPESGKTNLDKDGVNKRIMHMQSGDVFAIIGSRYSSVQEKLSAASKMPNVYKYFEGIYEDTRTVFDVGHTADYGKEELNTPLGGNFLDIQKHYNDSGALGKADRVRRAIQELHDVHIKYAITKETEIQDIKNIAHAGRDAFSTSWRFIIVTPQFREVNQTDINNLELGIWNKLKADLPDITASPSDQDLILGIMEAAFLAAGYKKKKFKTTVKGTVKNKKKPKVKVHKPKFPALREAGGRFTSITKLQAIINLSLHDQIKSNMGKGKAKAILNYRTGRFARSAKVTAISRTREDQIIAYYDYMRYPYDVFMPYGRLGMGYPGRNPQKLIARSIRQLVAKTIYGSMRVQPVANGGYQ